MNEGWMKRRLKRLLNIYFTWNYRYTDWHYNSEDGHMYWEVHSFFSIHPMIVGFKYLKLQWDGIPFRILWLGFLNIAWGESGGWRYLKDCKL